MKIEVSIGEILDKLTILSIKKEEIRDPAKLINVVKEFDYLFDIVVNDLKISTDSEIYVELLEVNRDLWIIEDRIREKERSSIFDDEFIELARSVYLVNDKRAKIKKTINSNFSSPFTEEKSYSDYS